MEIIDFKQTLDRLYETYQSQYISLDPLGIVRKYRDRRDQEIVAFIAALFALGRTDLIRHAVIDVLNRLGPSPYRFLMSFDPYRDQSLFDGFVYRFYRAWDVGLLMWWISQMLREDGSIRQFYLKEYHSGDRDIGPSLSHFVTQLRKMDTEPFYADLNGTKSGARHFLASPAGGSGCKRLNLFLRWMVRRDTLDLGLWQEISPAKLIIPLDTHIARIGRKLGFTQRTTQDWKMAVEITDSLRAFDPNDPVKYDFALCTMGKLIACPEKSGDSHCSYCPVSSFCHSFNDSSS